MNIPKVIFKEMSLEDNIDVIKWAYFEKEGPLSVHDFTVKLFPQLKNINSKDNIYELIEKVVTEEYSKNIEKIKEDTKKYNIFWEKYNDKYFKALSSFLNISFPDNVKTIEASVGLLPVYPRYLESFSFSIGLDGDEKGISRVCAHETLHFLWFEKWKQMHPETPKYEYDTPYLVWEYSEMVTDPILNNKPFTDMFNFKERGYDSFYELEYNGKKVMDELKEIYSRNIPIEEKIDIGFEYINKVFNEERSL